MALDYVFHSQAVALWALVLGYLVGTRLAELPFLAVFALHGFTPKNRK